MNLYDIYHFKTTTTTKKHKEKCKYDNKYEY